MSKKSNSNHSGKGNLFLKTIKWLILGFFISSISMVILYRFVPVYYTPLMFIRSMQNRAEGKEVKTYHSWVPIEKMTINMPIAVIASEDQRFMTHHGFDFEAIKDAAEHNKTHKKKRGASTISQQTAKNVFLWPQRSWIRKGLEAYFTVLIELFWSKERIAEVYLNSIEMGDGIYGVEAVAQQHFHKTAASLSKANCALIAATLPNPRRFSSAKPSPYMIKRQHQILQQMKFFSKDIFKK